MKNQHRRVLFYLLGTVRENIRSILKTGLDQQPLPVLVAAAGEPVTHENIRGAAYYGSAVEGQDDMEVAR